MKILLVEGNRVVSETLSLSLKQNYKVVNTSSYGQALLYIDKNRADIIIIDLNLPDKSGISLCSDLRKIGVIAPILVLSTDNSLDTKIKVFEAGADDYLIKPFSLGEFLVRLKALARRLESYNVLLANLGTPKLVLDSGKRSVIRDGSQSINLRRKEFALLEHLLKHAGETVTRQHLTTYAWKQENDAWSNTVDVHIKHLRDKIDRPFKRKLITTIHGHGYRLETE